MFTQADCKITDISHICVGLYSVLLLVKSYIFVLARYNNYELCQSGNFLDRYSLYLTRSVAKLEIQHFTSGPDVFIEGFWTYKTFGTLNFFFPNMLCDHLTPTQNHFPMCHLKCGFIANKKLILHSVNISTLNEVHTIMAFLIKV